MSREIKFRCVNEETGQVFDGDYIEEADNIVVSLSYGELVAFSVTTAGDYIPLKLIEYTGLKDKNGVEIYDGDILEVSPGYLFEVLWVNNGWGYKVIKNETERGYIIGHLSQRGLEFYNQSSRVIGNIYSHPRLLEETES